MNLSQQKDLVAIFRELVYRWRLWLVLAFVLSAIFLGAGMMLPKNYTSNASIVVEDRNIIGPLMEGMAEQTDISTISKIVRDMALGRDLLNSILDAGGFVEADASAADRERARTRLSERTEISQRRDNIITIEYTDNEPQRAQMVTSMFVEHVLARSDEQKREESQRAFDFIDAQVRDYHSKLRLAEDELQMFRSNNLEALPESAADVRMNASRLRQQLEQTRLELQALLVKRNELIGQISGEKEVTRSLEREAELRARKLKMEQDLDTLRLSYHDTYPDITRLKNQIVALDDELRAMGVDPDKPGIMNQALSIEQDRDGRMVMPLNPLYDQLRQELAKTETSIASHRSQISTMEEMLSSQIQRGGDIALTEVELAELTRDYDVNSEIYSDLLHRRENARLSMLIDEQQGGLKMRLQEPPAVPQTPSGLRFGHVAGASIFLVLMMPFVLSAGFVKLDPRLRTADQVAELGLPVLATVPAAASSAAERSRNRMIMVFGFGALIGLYILAMVIK